jgi:hypothetical protein
MLYSSCTGIYKFGNNTYPRRIRRRSNLGTFFGKKSVSYGPGSTVHHRQLVVTLFALSWLKCKSIVDPVQFLVWHYSVRNCDVMTVVVVMWHHIHEELNLKPSAVRISVFLFSLAETEPSGTGDNETSSYACCYNGCVTTCAKKLEPPIGKKLTPCPSLQRFVSIFRTVCILL